MLETAQLSGDSLVRNPEHGPGLKRPNGTFDAADFLNPDAARRYGTTVAVFRQNSGLTQDAQ
jgi:hypothetical protein